MGREKRLKKVSIIAWSGDLDKAYPVLILATTAAASGAEVTIFFTFWGLFLLKRNDRWISGKCWMTRMLHLMNRGGSKHLTLSRLHMMGAGTGMMKAIFRKNRVPSLDEFLEMSKDLGIKLVPCQMSMEALGLGRDDLIEGVSDPAGAATALEEAAASDVTLFI